MIAYSTLGTSDMDRSIAFYDAVFGALGAAREKTTAKWTQYGRSGDRAKVCLVVPFDGGHASHGNGAMLAFEVNTRAAVERFHAAALEFGGNDEGAPAVREGTHFAAYARDPDGNKLCAFALT